MIWTACAMNTKIPYSSGLIPPAPQLRALDWEPEDKIHVKTLTQPVLQPRHWFGITAAPLPAFVRAKVADVRRLEPRNITPQTFGITVAVAKASAFPFKEGRADTSVL